MREPTLQGPAGKAWEIVGDGGPGLVSYLLHVPGAHIAWGSWLVGVVHLRPVAGMAPPKLHYPTAGHEFLIVSVNPERHGMYADPDGGPFHFLEPADVVYQFDGLTDAQAMLLGTLAAQRIVEGMLSPDSDFRRLWVELLTRTVQHMKAGDCGPMSQ